MLKNKRGFTGIEVLIALVIAGIMTITIATEPPSYVVKDNSIKVVELTPSGEGNLCADQTVKTGFVLIWNGDYDEADIQVAHGFIDGVGHVQPLADSTYYIMYDDRFVENQAHISPYWDDFDKEPYIMSFNDYLDDLRLFDKYNDRTLDEKIDQFRQANGF